MLSAVAASFLYRIEIAEVSMRPRPSTALALLLLLALPARALAQDAAAGDFGEELSVTVVQVPVRVHRDGVPVAGLTAADFEVYDNGERRELSSFEVVDLRPTGSRPASSADGDEDATTQGRRLLLLVDFAYSPSQELMRALRSMERMVAEQLHPADRMAIATYSHRRGVQVLVGFTDDRPQLLSALQGIRATLELGPRAARGRKRGEPLTQREPAVDLARLSASLGAGAALAVTELDPEQEPAVRGALWSSFVATLPAVQVDDGTTLPEGPASGVAFLTAEAMADSLASDANTRTELTKMRLLASNLSGLATLLRGVGGQKLLLWVSRGFPSFLLEEQASAELETTLFEPFRRAGWQIETLDIRGVPDAFGGSLPGLGLPEGAPPPATVAFQAHTLLYVARGTGGEVYENYADLADATRSVLARTELTYLLGFTVADQRADGRYRKLEVRLRGGNRGARLTHREGYYAAKPERSRTDLEQRLDVAERLFGGEEGGTLEATAQAFPLRARGRRGDGTVLRRGAGGRLRRARRRVAPQRAHPRLCPGPRRRHRRRLFAPARHPCGPPARARPPLLRRAAGCPGRLPDARRGGGRRGSPLVGGYAAAARRRVRRTGALAAVLRRRWKRLGGGEARRRGAGVVPLHPRRARRDAAAGATPRSRRARAACCWCSTASHRPAPRSPAAC